MLITCPYCRNNVDITTSTPTAQVWYDTVVLIRSVLSAEI